MKKRPVSTSPAGKESVSVLGFFPLCCFTSTFSLDEKILEVVVLLQLLLRRPVLLPEGERLGGVAAVSGENCGNDLVVLLLVQPPMPIVVEELAPGRALNGTDHHCQRAQRQRGHARRELPAVAERGGLVWTDEGEETVSGSDPGSDLLRLFRSYLPRRRGSWWCSELPVAWAAVGGRRLPLWSRLSSCGSVPASHTQT